MPQAATPTSVQATSSTTRGTAQTRPAITSSSPSRRRCRRSRSVSRAFGAGRRTRQAGMKVSSMTSALTMPKAAVSPKLRTDGVCVVKLDGSTESKTYGAGTHFDVPAKSGFSIAVDSGVAQYVCSFLK